MGPRKIAILGGGTGALAAAFGLTSGANWKEQYDVTVYQLGWRLGGKGASGRNAEYGQRIEEHGLHVWAGFYDNAFRLMRDCYAELGRRPTEPLATVWEAFRPKSDATVTEFIRGQWLKWHVNARTNDQLPGDDGELPSTWGYIRMLLEWALDHLEESGLFRDLSTSTSRHARPLIPDWLWNRVQAAEAVLRETRDPSILAHHPRLAAFERELTQIGQAVHWLLLGTRRLLKSISDEVARDAVDEHQAVLFLIRELREHVKAFVEDRIEKDDALRRVWLFLDFGIATVVGLIADGVVLRGFASIDDQEWRTWLQRHGATPTTVHSVITRATYDYVFGYLQGDVDQASIGAGSCTHGLMRLTLTYKGALFWEMQAGMGDTVFAPLYLVLRNRGVKFRFFHRVDQIRLSPDDPTVVDAIDLGVQVQPRGGGEYDPLIDVRGLPCWPSRPLFDQLVDGDKLRQSGENLESPWANWPDAEQLTLRKGRDFDDVVLGISVAALEALTPQLVTASPRWADMVRYLRTTQTQAVQLWLKQDALSLGWPSSLQGLVTAYEDDLNTWADLSHLLEREAWHAPGAPKNVSYFCGPLRDAKVGSPANHHDFPDCMDADVKRAAIEWLKSHMHVLLPGSAPNGDFDWEQLVADAAVCGPSRFDSQYWRANVAPSERYVLSAAGTTKYRLTADGSGFTNLFLAGDWVATAINAGCVEAAVMAGLAASRAICGHPVKILGETSGAKE